MWGIRHFRPFLCGKTFRVVIGHKPLLNIQTTKHEDDPTGRRTRRSTELSSYVFTRIERKWIADYLSRMPISENIQKVTSSTEGGRNAHETMAHDDKTPTDIAAAQDPELRIIKEIERNKETSVGSPSGQTGEYKSHSTEGKLFIEDSVLKRLHVDVNEIKRRQVVLRRKTVPTYMKELHEL